MNPDIIQNYKNDRNLNSINTNLKTNYESYYNFKKVQNKKEWPEIYKPDKITDIKPSYNYSYNLPWDHGYFNKMTEYNTLGNYKHNYIAPAYRYYEEFPSVGIISSVMKIRNQ